MYSLDLDKLTPEQRAMVALWEEHLKPEFQDKDARASCGTMVANPYVNHVAVLTGGVGRRQLEHYYKQYFIPGAAARRGDRAHLPDRRPGPHRGRVRLSLHAFNPDGLALARDAADRATAGVGRGDDRHLRGRQDTPRAHPLGPGVGTGAVGPPRSGEPPSGWGRGRSQNPRSDSRAVKPADETNDR
jgi:hypothetical protein